MCLCFTKNLATRSNCLNLFLLRLRRFIILFRFDRFTCYTFWSILVIKPYTQSGWYYVFFFPLKKKLYLYDCLAFRYNSSIVVMCNNCCHTFVVASPPLLHAVWHLIKPRGRDFQKLKITNGLRPC